jgi:hypothetical protein
MPEFRELGKGICFSLPNQPQQHTTSPVNKLATIPLQRHGIAFLPNRTSLERRRSPEMSEESVECGGR